MRFGETRVRVCPLSNACLFVDPAVNKAASRVEGRVERRRRARRASPVQFGRRTNVVNATDPGSTLTGLPEAYVKRERASA